MPTQTKLLQKIVQDYINAGEAWPASAHEIAKWAVNNKRWQPQSSAIINQCADRIAQAMREEYITDPQGRKVRAKHAIKMERDGKQVGFWDDMRWASREHMGVAFQQRRQQVVGDCRQLKTDLDSYNDNYNKESPIQMSFNFTHDLEELELGARRSKLSVV
ncbi:MAG: hypothetical protein GXX82_16460 [Syntrophorhabdus sp.]|nr:hypothetical protein [Syntrophorhabdus sp.]